MKRKNLNTIIKKTFENGDGLPFKEEYWNQMNELLDEHLPVKQSTQPSFSFKNFLFEITLFALLIGAHAFSFVNNKTIEDKTLPTSLAINQPTETASQQSELDNKQTENGLLKTTNDIEHHLLSPSLKSNTASMKNKRIEEYNPSNLIENTNSKNLVSYSNAVTEKTAYKMTVQPNESNNTYAETKSIANDLKLPSVELNNITEMNELTSILKTKLEDYTFTLTPSNPQFLQYPYRHSFIKHVAILPYVNLVTFHNTLTLSKNLTIYTIPKQNRIGGGVNIELTLKKFAVRTGIGYGSFLLNQVNTSSRNIFDYDTSFIIINPSYGTTPSGNPVALIKRQIDSSLQATESISTESNIVHQYFSIPLTLQYFINHKKIQLMAEAGMIHNFISNGRVAQTESKNETQNTIPFPRYAPQLTFGTGIRYHMNTKLFMSLQYNFTYLAHKQDFPFFNKGNTFSVGVGYRLW